jgi:hypothetical protein
MSTAKAELKALTGVGSSALSGWLAEPGRDYFRELLDTDSSA